MTSIRPPSKGQLAPIDPQFVHPTIRFAEGADAIHSRCAWKELTMSAHNRPATSRI
jgi:hypothetical protein